MEATDVPSGQATQADPASTLAWIQSRLHNIYSATKHLQPGSQVVSISASDYAELYGATVNYCAVTKAKPHKGDLKGEDLYYSMEREIRAYCSDVRHEIFLKENQDLDRDIAERLLKMYLSVGQVHEVGQTCQEPFAVLGKTLDQETDRAEA